MDQHAKGTFIVDITPQTSDENAGVTVGRMTLDKTYEGALVATGKGEMLTARTPIPGSAGYVAIERVSGILNGKEGSFVLQHHGTMAQGEQALTVSIVPDSGTGELTGITGQCVIEMADGKHFYDLSYSVPEP